MRKRYCFGIGILLFVLLCLFLLWFYWPFHPEINWEGSPYIVNLKYEGQEISLSQEEEKKLLEIVTIGFTVMPVLTAGHDSAAIRTFYRLFPRSWNCGKMISTKRQIGSCGGKYDL